MIGFSKSRVDSKDVLIVRQGGDIAFDFRLVKQINTLLEAGRDVSVLFFHFQGKYSRSFKLWGLVPVASQNLLVRKAFPPGRALLVKQLEQMLRVLFFVLYRRPRVVCLQNEVFALAIPILWLYKRVGIIDRLVWDLRELPHAFLDRNAIYKLMLRVLVKMCDSVSSCNVERLRYLTDACSLRDRDGLVVINNFPDAKFATAESGVLPAEIVEWLGGSMYVYAQSIREPDRYLMNFVESIMRVDRLKAIVTGARTDADSRRLLEKYGDKLRSRILFVGQVPTNSLKDYLDGSVGSVVLYEASSPNRRFCAANRLYQSLCRGVPVVVGCNPTMANVISATQAGVVLSTDGCSVDDLVGSLERLLDEREALKRRACSVRHDYVWENQVAELLAFFGAA